MLIPTPQQNEDKYRFVSRCTAFLEEEGEIDNGESRAQAYAICSAQYQNKVLSKVDKDRVGQGASPSSLADLYSKLVVLIQ